MILESAFMYFTTEILPADFLYGLYALPFVIVFGYVFYKITTY